MVFKISCVVLVVAGLLFGSGVGPPEYQRQTVMGIRYAAKSEWQESHRAFERAIANQPNDVKVRVHRIHLLGNRLSADELKSDTELLLKLEGEDAYGILRDALPEKALETLIDSYRHSGSELIRLAKSAATIDEAKVQRGLDLLDRAIALDQSSAESFRWRAAEYANLERQQEAVDDYSRAIALDSLEWQDYASRGYLYRGLKQTGQALADFDRAIELAPNESTPYGHRGLLLQELGQNERAIADFTKTIELAPWDPNGYISRAISYGALERHQDAVRDLNEAVNRDPDTPSYYVYRGNAYAELGDVDAALADFTRAIELDPDYGYAYYLQAAANCSLGRRAEAAIELQTAIRLAPEFKDAFYEVLLALGCASPTPAAAEADAGGLMMIRLASGQGSWF